MRPDGVAGWYEGATIKDENYLMIIANIPPVGYKNTAFSVFPPAFQRMKNDILIVNDI